MKGVTEVSTKHCFLKKNKKKNKTNYKLLPIRDATIIDFVGTIIVWGIITVLRLLCIY